MTSMQPARPTAGPWQRRVVMPMLLTAPWALLAAWLWLASREAGDAAATPAAIPGVHESAAPAVGFAVPEGLQAAPVSLASPATSGERGAWTLRTAPIPVAVWETPFGESDERRPCTLVVVDQLDRPVAGARVQQWGKAGEDVDFGGIDTPRVVLKEFPPVGPIEAVTDAEGRCTIQPLRHEPRVLVEKQGVGSSGWFSPATTTTPPRELVVPLLRPAHVRGRVIWPHGAPASGAMVSLSDDGPPGAPPRGPGSLVTDDEGRFDVEVDGAGTCSLRATLGEVSTPWRLLPLSSGSVHDVVLRLPGDWRLRGTVRRPAGAEDLPLAGLEVSFLHAVGAVPDDGFPRGGATWVEAEADELGRYSIRLDGPASGWLMARTGAWGVALPEPVTIAPVQPRLDVDLVLGPPGWICGRVVDEAGGGLAGATVRAHAVRSARLAGNTEVPESALHGSTEAQAAGDGRFMLGPLHAQGMYDLWVHIGDGDSQRIVSARGVQAGTDDVLLALGGPCEQDASVELLAVSAATGRPVPAVSLTYALRRAGEAWGDRVSSSRRNEHGLFTIDRLLPGTEVWMAAYGDDLGTVKVEGVSATREGTGLRIELPALASLDVQVTGDGGPASLACINWELDARGVIRPPSSRCSGRGRADARGQRRFTGLEPGHYVLTVLHGERDGRAEVDLAPGEEGAVVMELR